MYLILAIIIIIAYIYFTRKREPVDHHRPDALPDILARAECIMNEADIRTQLPVPLHGRVDQVFRLDDGRLLILDTKTRSRPNAYPSDIVQISVYALILKYRGHRVSSVALLRFPNVSGVPVYLPVRLYPEDKIIALYHRYIHLYYSDDLPPCTCGKHYN